MKHVFVGVGVFLLLAIPAIALDFFNQGVGLIEIRRAVEAQSNKIPQHNENNVAVDGTHNNSDAPIRVSEPVKLTLHLVEYFILLVDVVFVVAYLVNGTWKYMRSLEWQTKT